MTKKLLSLVSMLLVCVAFSARSAFGEVAETRYSANKGASWTEGSLANAVTFANKNASQAIGGLAGKGGNGIVIIYYTAVQTGSAVLIR